MIFFIKDERVLGDIRIAVFCFICVSCLGLQEQFFIDYKEESYDVKLTATNGNGDTGNLEILIGKILEFKCSLARHA